MNKKNVNVDDNHDDDDDGHMIILFLCVGKIFPIFLRKTKHFDFMYILSLNQQNYGITASVALSFHRQTANSVYKILTMRSAAFKKLYNVIL